MSTPVNHGRSWTDEANADLRSMFEQGLALEVIAAKMDRTQGAICGQLERLKLVVNFGGVIHRIDPTPWVDLRKLRQPTSERLLNIINATPPADFPNQVIILDKELGRRHPNKAFYLRVQTEDGVEHVDLAGAVTPVEARSMAREKGYAPTHWMTVGDARPMMF